MSPPCFFSIFLTWNNYVTVPDILQWCIAHNYIRRCQSNIKGLETAIRLFEAHSISTFAHQFENLGSSSFIRDPHLKLVGTGRFQLHNFLQLRFSWGGSFNSQERIKVLALGYIFLLTPFFRYIATIRSSNPYLSQ